MEYANRAYQNVKSALDYPETCAASSSIPGTMRALNDHMASLIKSAQLAREMASQIEGFLVGSSAPEANGKVSPAPSGFIGMSEAQMIDLGGIIDDIRGALERLSQKLG